MGDPAAGPPPGAGEQPELTPEQQEQLRQMEEEMRRVRVQDLLTQSTVSILNLAYRRIAKEDERDLEQARVGIDAVAAMAELIEPEAQREVKNALSQVRMAYAQAAQAAGESGEGTDAGSAPGGQPSAGEGAAGSGAEQPPRRPGTPPPGLWVPGSD